MTCRSKVVAMKPGKLRDTSERLELAFVGLTASLLILGWSAKRLNDALSSAECQNADKPTATRADSETLTIAGQEQKTSIFRLGA